MINRLTNLLNRFYYFVFDRLILYPMLYLLKNRCNIHFMNLGYQPAANDEIISCAINKFYKADTAEKAHASLYEKTLSLCPKYPVLQNISILEVGCGHGGGVRWIER